MNNSSSHSSSPVTHEDWLKVAIEFFEDNNVQPFTIVNISIVYKNNNEEDDIKHLIFHHILGISFTVGGSVNRVLVPYLYLATGHLMKTLGGALFNTKETSFFQLYEQKKKEREEWLSKETITLDKIDKMAHDYVENEEKIEFFENLERQRKYAKKEFKNRHINRWSPYVDLVLTRDGPKESMERQVRAIVVESCPQNEQIADTKIKE